MHRPRLSVKSWNLEFLLLLLWLEFEILASGGERALVVSARNSFLLFRHFFLLATCDWRWFFLFFFFENVFIFRLPEWSSRKRFCVILLHLNHSFWVSLDLARARVWEEVDDGTKLISVFDLRLNEENWLKWSQENKVERKLVDWNVMMVWLRESYCLKSGFSWTEFCWFNRRLPIVLKLRFEYDELPYHWQIQLSRLKFNIFTQTQLAVHLFCFVESVEIAHPKRFLKRFSKDWLRNKFGLTNQQQITIKDVNQRAATACRRRN